MTYEEAKKTLIYDLCECCDAFMLRSDGESFCTRNECNIKTAIEALDRCKMIDEAKYLRYEQRENLCEEDISYERGYNDCLRWAKEKTIANLDTYLEELHKKIMKYADGVKDAGNFVEMTMDFFKND